MNLLSPVKIKKGPQMKAFSCFIKLLYQNVILAKHISER